MPTPSHPASTDLTPMARALALAAEAVGLASPNPTVGCVLISPSTGQILGQGAHLYANRDHAEIAALKQAAALGHSVQGATAFVTLEPCAHHGRTGPCAVALGQARIGRCVVATTDPNPLVSGKGLAILEDAGIPVTLGPGAATARALNLPFAHAIQHHRPFITLKSALSADGFLAPPPGSRTAAAPVWLTGPLARAEVHRLRHASDAILTGIGTVLADDPALTDRSGLARRRPLLRVILDPALRTPLTSHLLRTTQPDLLLLYADPTHTAIPDPDLLARKAALQTACPAAEILPIPTTEAGRLHLPAVLDLLATRQILSLLLEAGPALNAAFLAQDLVDRLVLFHSPVTLGPHSLPFATSGPTPTNLLPRLTHRTERTLGPDRELIGLLHDPWPNHL